MPRQSSDPLFAHFNTERHRLWKQDRLLRQRVPVQHAWRGCLGLAMLLSNVEQTEYPTDQNALIPNENVTWLCLRDIPRNHFPSVLAMNRREVHYVNTARAVLHHGMPVIDFAQNLRDAWDLRFMPFGSYQRPSDRAGSALLHGCGDVLNCDQRPLEFAVLNRLTAAMTRFAFCAIDDRGQGLRQHWAAAKPDQWAKFSPSLPAQWLPRPYLAFRQRHRTHVQDHCHIKGLRVDADFRIALFPAERVGRLVRDLRPVGLWWDLQPCSRYLDGQLEAAVFPPIPLKQWDQLRFSLPGEALLDARIADPRFSPIARRSTQSVPTYSPERELFNSHQLPKLPDPTRQAVIVMVRVLLNCRRTRLRPSPFSV